EAIYGTRGGPWQPVDGQYGYTYKGSTVFAHLFKGHAGDTFQVPPMGKLAVRRVRDVFTGRDLAFVRSSDGGVSVRGIDRKASPADTIIAVDYDRPITAVWED